MANAEAAYAQKGKAMLELLGQIGEEPKTRVFVPLPLLGKNEIRGPTDSSYHDFILCGNCGGKIGTV